MRAGGSWPLGATYRASRKSNSEARRYPGGRPRSRLVLILRCIRASPQPIAVWHRHGRATSRTRTPASTGAGRRRPRSNASTDPSALRQTQGESRAGCGARSPPQPSRGSVCHAHQEEAACLLRPGENGASAPRPSPSRRQSECLPRIRTPLAKTLARAWMRAWWPSSRIRLLRTIWRRAVRPSTDDRNGRESEREPAGGSDPSCSSNSRVGRRIAARLPLPSRRERLPVSTRVEVMRLRTGPLSGGIDCSPVSCRLA
jgi:hypothetical protein